ncbi:MAG: sigma-70 family RNA polymerase sigma factor [Candidatus Eisenbacteria bacterium]
MSRDEAGTLPKHTGLSDEQLMLRVGQGDRGAFDEIVRRYTRKMINLAYQITSDRDLAEDIAQETFLRAYKSAARYTEIAKFSTWLYTIAINLCRNELRRRKFKPYSLEEMAEREDEGKLRIDIADETRMPDTDLEKKEITAHVRRAISMVPSKFRVALVLRDIQGLSYEEVGGILGLPEGTVKSRINRGRLRVREILSPIFDEKARTAGDSDEL